MIYSRVDEQELTAENAERRREENVDDSPSLRSFAFSAVSLISRNVSFFQRIYHSPNRMGNRFHIELLLLPGVDGVSHDRPSLRAPKRFHEAR